MYLRGMLKRYYPLPAERGIVTYVSYDPITSWLILTHRGQ